MRFSFKLFGVPVTVGFDFLLIISLLGFRRLSEPLFFFSWIAVAFIAILLHELGHALAYRAFGSSPWIRLYSFGGQTGVTGGKPLKRWQELLVVLAGPLTGLVIGGLVILFFPLIPTTDTTRVVFSDILFVTIGWGLLNLMPLHPLDGGQIARLIITRLFKKRGEKIFYGFSMVTAAGIAGVALYFEMYWIAILAGFLAWNNLTALRRLSALGDDRELTGELQQIYTLLKEDRFEEAREAADNVASKSVSAPLLGHAHSLRAWALYKLGRAEEALQVLESVSDQRYRDPFLFGILLQAAGRHREAREPLLRSFHNRPHNETAVMLIENLRALQDFTTLYDVLRRHPEARIASPLYGSVADWFHEHGRYPEAAEISGLCFSKYREPDAAYKAARATAAAGDAKSALRWLSKAVEAGFSDVAAVTADPNLTSLSGDRRFIKLVERMRGRQ
ncbi:MAG TPA: hypothetical protein ENN69_06460 [Spirochaetia bacterium]|nr:hypothetical protein [Spirochaetia bacterium]